MSDNVQGTRVYVKSDQVAFHEGRKPILYAHYWMMKGILLASAVRYLQAFAKEISETLLPGKVK